MAKLNPKELIDRKKHPLLFVEYDDHAGTHSWREAEEVSLTRVPLYTVGFLLKEDKETLVLASSADARTGVGEYSLRSGARSYIVKRAIVRRVRLKCPL